MGTRLRKWRALVGYGDSTRRLLTARKTILTDTFVTRLVCIHVLHKVHQFTHATARWANPAPKRQGE